MRRRPASAPPPFPHATEARVKYASVALLLALRHHLTASIRPLRARAPVADYGQLAADVAAAGRDAGRYLRTQNYRRLLSAAAERAARDIARHTSGIVGWSVPVATLAPAAFVTAAEDKAEEMMDGMAECMAGRLEEWLAGGFPDEALDASLQECQDKHASRWFWWLTLMAGWFAGAVAAETYRAAGVTECEWQSRDDRRVRPAHHALDGTRFTYDGPAPLTADKSSNGEPCFPGQDYNCRCRPRIVSYLARPRENAARAAVRSA